MTEPEGGGSPTPESDRERNREPWSRILIVTLLIVLAWAGLLRFVGITRSRLLLCDESFYLLEARRIIGQARACLKIYEVYRRDRPSGLIQLPPADRAAVEALATDGYGQLGGRFGHDVFLAAALSVGLAPEWCGQLVGALFGIATVLLVTLWSARAWGLRTALFAAAFLGGSVVHLTYSRSALCESDSVFFITGALVAYVAGLEASAPGRRHAWSAGAGLLFGCAFICNIRAIPVAYGLFVFEATQLRPRESAVRLLIFAAGAAFPLLIAEALYHVVFLFSGASGVLLTRQTYLITILWQIFRLKGGLISAGANLGHYPRFLTTVENPVFLSCALMGLLYLSWRALERDRMAERLIAVVVAVSALYWQFAVGIKCLRYLAPLFPLAAVAAGIGIADLHGRLARRFRLEAPALILAILFLILSSSACIWSRWQGATPGYQEAARWLAQQKTHRLVATQANYFRLVFPMADVEVASSLDHLKLAHGKGFRWYVDCFQKYHWPIANDLIAIQQFLNTQAKPRVFEHPMAASPFTWFEAGMADVPADWNADAGTIKIWDLDEVFHNQP